MKTIWRLRENNFRIFAELPKTLFQDHHMGSIKPLLQPVNTYNDPRNQIEFLHVIFENYMILLQSFSYLGPQNYETFHTFNIKIHELKEEKSQGEVPCEIIKNGACLYNENTILALGKTKDNGSHGNEIFFLTEFSWRFIGNKFKNLVQEK